MYNTQITELQSSWQTIEPTCPLIKTRPIINQLKYLISQQYKLMKTENENNHLNLKGPNKLIEIEKLKLMLVSGTINTN